MKGDGSFAKNLVILTVIIVVLLFSYVYLLEEVRAYSKNKIRKEEELLGKKDELEARLVEVQKLSDEERIVKIAEDSLTMVRSLKPFEIIPVSKNQIRQIEDIISKKYEQ